MLEIVQNLHGRHIVSAGDFNFFPDTSLDSNGDKPALKKKSIATFIELKEKFNLRDIWRIKNTKTKRYSFRQKYVFGSIQSCLDYFFISNSIQISIKNADVLASVHCILHISPYWVRMRENTGKKKLCIWTLFTQCSLLITFLLHFPVLRTKKSAKVQAFENLITSWLKMKNIFTRWKNLFQIL